MSNILSGISLFYNQLVVIWCVVIFNPFPYFCLDEQEFQRLLLLFPVVRNSDYYQADSASSGQSSSQAARNEEVNEWQDAWAEQEINKQDVFWDKLRSTAERKVGAAKAERFCDAFQKIYRKLVHEELSKEVMESFLNSSWSGYWFNGLCGCPFFQLARSNARI